MRGHFLVMASECPPDDRPWLISNRVEVEEDERRVADWRARWATAEYGWPGARSTLAAKLAWAQRVKAVESDWEMIMDGGCPSNVDEHVAAILDARCPAADVELLIVVEREHAARVLADAPAGSAAAAARDGAGAGAGELTLARGAAPKGASVSKACTQLLERAGLGALRGRFVLARAAGAGYLPHYLSFPRGATKLGELPYYDGDDGEVRVALQLVGLQAARAPSPFERALEARSAASGDQPYLLVPRPAAGGAAAAADGEDDDEDDDDDKERAATEETHAALWLPRGFHEIRARVGDHVARGEGEPSDIQMRLDKGNTDTGHLMQMIIRAEFEAINETRPRGVSAAGDTPRRLATLLALTEAMACNDIWMHDTEDEEEVEELLADVAREWRNKLLVHKNDAAALGLGAADESDAAKAASREALLALLGIFKRRIEAAGHAFNFKPGPPRKRKAAADLAGAPARAPLGAVNCAVRA